MICLVAVLQQLILLGNHTKGTCMMPAQSSIIVLTTVTRFLRLHELYSIQLSKLITDAPDTDDLPKFRIGVASN